MGSKAWAASIIGNDAYARINLDTIGSQGSMLDRTATSKIRRYRSQSLRLLESAFAEMRNGRWMRSEELIWGSLTLAVKGVAVSRGDEVDGDAAVKEYAIRLGQENRDRRIREAFNQLSGFSETVDRVRESRSRVDYLFLQLDDVSSAIERLWELVPPDNIEGFPSVEPV